jgi:hypothetical protein
MTIGVFCAVIVAFALAVNGAYMLVSPQAWFRLPGLIRLSGTLTEKRYGSGLGAVQVRLTGGIMLALIAWCIYHALVRQAEVA